MPDLRVLRICHAGGDSGHRARDRALLRAGVDLTLVVPASWPGADADISDVPVRRLPVRRAGDVNRHAYLEPSALAALVRDVRPDLVDIHEEPVSLAARQWLRAAAALPVVMYTAQNLDKRWPPPFAQYERAALQRAAGMYPCSNQAASVLRGKGYRGQLQVLPLGIDDDVHRAGDQVLPAEEVVLGLVGRLVPEKGVLDAVHVLAAVNERLPARLVVIGDGPERARAQDLSRRLGIAKRCTWLPWCPVEQLAAAYRRMHIVLVPSLATARWVEQFGRVITEGRANGAVPVGYTSGSIPEVMGQTGVLVPEGDVAALSAEATELLTDPARWSSLRQRGRDAGALLSWDYVAAGQLALYEAAVVAEPSPMSRASRRTRCVARREYGAPATTPAGARPIALPFLREAGAAPRLLAALVDRTTGQA